MVSRSKGYKKVNSSIQPALTALCTLIFAFPLLRLHILYLPLHPTCAGPIRAVDFLLIC